MTYSTPFRFASSIISVSSILALLLFSLSANFFNKPNADSDNANDVLFFFDIPCKCGNFTVIKH